MQPIDFEGFNIQEIKGVGSAFSFLSANFLLLILAFVFVVAVIMTIVLFYHWRRYGSGNAIIGFAGIVYLAGVVIFLTAAAASATSF